MDISLIPCMPGIILPPSWGAYKCVLCDCGVIMFFRKASPQTEGEGVSRNADPKIKTPPARLEDGIVWHVRDVGRAQKKVFN